MKNVSKVGVLGASSHVGQALLALLVKEGIEVFAFSRQLSSYSQQAVFVDSASGSGVNGINTNNVRVCKDEGEAATAEGLEVAAKASPTQVTGDCQSERGYWRNSHYSDCISPSIHWRPVSTIESVCKQEKITYWICLAPIWVVSDYFTLFQASHTKRIVVLSSTSRFSKQQSPDSTEQALARCLADSEAGIKTWAESCGIEFVILRPTLIYGLGRDRNICEIIRLIRRFGFFPLLGEAKGLRQPVHCTDVARACISALSAPAARNKCYNLSGAEILPYKDMVTRIFEAVNRSPRFFHVPLSLLRVILGLLRLLPRYRRWKSSMLERVNQNLVFDHQEATRDLGFKPRPFRLTTEDLP